MGTPTIASDPYYLDTIQEYYGDSLESDDMVWREYCLQNNLSSSSTPDSLTGTELTAWQNFLSTHPKQVLWTKYQGLWDAFSEQQGISDSSSPSTPELQKAFRTFVQRCMSWGVSLDEISSQNTIPSGSAYDFYRTYLKSFYGDLSPTLQDMLWNKFVAQQGYSVVGPVYQNPPDSISLRAAFSKFISALQSRDASNEAELALSPAELNARVVAYEIINALSGMLTAAQQSVKVQAQTLMFLGRYQQMYTQMMTSVPTLTSGDPGKLDLGATDASKIDAKNFTFGYYKISLHQVAQWALSEAKASPGTTVTWGNVATMGTYSFTYNEGSPDTVTVSFSAMRSPFEDPVTSSQTFNAVYESGEISTTSKNLGRPLSFDDLVTKAEKNLISAFSAVPNFVQMMQGRSAITGRWLSSGGETDDAAKKKADSDIQARTEQNAILQQYTDNIRSLRTTISTKTTQLQTALQEARDAIDRTTDLWTAVLDTINTCMKAVFKSS
jgi:hypothetical protein